MFKNFFKVAVRNLIRQKAYALINIIGLAIGIACSILIVLFVLHENSYDTFHKEADQIYRVWVTGRFADSEFKSANTAVPSGPAFVDEIPEVINFTRVDHSSNVLIRHGDKTFMEDNFYWADSGFLEMFSYPFIHGDPFSALTEPRSMVISESTARRYFGDGDPMGKTLELFTDSVDYTITGVMKDVQENSHMKFDMLVDYQSNGRANETQWTSSYLHTYLLT